MGPLWRRNPEIAGLLDGLTLIASRAAAAILAVPRLDLNQRNKPDASPVTAADDASETVILAGLARLMPGVPVVSEETTGNRPVEGLGRRFLVVDPLDGTREFLAGLDEFTVNIALIENETPVAGVVAAPARGLIWRGYVGHGAERLALAPGAAPDSARARRHSHPRASRQRRARPDQPLASRCGHRRLCRSPAAAGKIACGSALKFCLLAEGSADLYPRLGPTSEWDIAAGHAVLVAAGGGDAQARRQRAPLWTGQFPGRRLHRHGRRHAALIADQRALQLRPVPLGGFDGACGIPGKGRARLGAVEQIKPLLRDQPERRMSRRRRAARHRHRIVAAEARHIHLGSGRECRTVAFVLEPPGRAAGAQFQLGAAFFRRGLDEIGDRVEAIDGQARCSG